MKRVNPPLPWSLMSEMIFPSEVSFREIRHFSFLRDPSLALENLALSAKRAVQSHEWGLITYHIDSSPSSSILELPYSLVVPVELDEKERFWVVLVFSSLAKKEGARLQKVLLYRSLPPAMESALVQTQVVWRQEKSFLDLENKRRNQDSSHPMKSSAERITLPPFGFFHFHRGEGNQVLELGFRIEDMRISFPWTGHREFILRYLSHEKNEIRTERYLAYDEAMIRLRALWAKKNQQEMLSLPSPSWLENIESNPDYLLISNPFDHLLDEVIYKSIQYTLPRTAETIERFLPHTPRWLEVDLDKFRELSHIFTATLLPIAKSRISFESDARATLGTLEDVSTEDVQLIDIGLRKLETLWTQSLMNFFRARFGEIHREKPSIHKTQVLDPFVFYLQGTIVERWKINRVAMSEKDVSFQVGQFSFLALTDENLSDEDILLRLSQIKAFLCGNNEPLQPGDGVLLNEILFLRSMIQLQHTSIVLREFYSSILVEKLEQAIAKGEDWTPIMESIDVSSNTDRVSSNRRWANVLQYQFRTALFSHRARQALRSIKFLR